MAVQLGLVHSLSVTTHGGSCGPVFPLCLSATQHMDASPKPLQCPSSYLLLSLSLLSFSLNLCFAAFKDTFDASVCVYLFLSSFKRFTKLSKTQPVCHSKPGPRYGCAFLPIPMMIVT